MVPTAAVLRVLCVTLRGVVKPKDEGGTVRIQCDPTMLAHVVFFKSGRPVAVGIIKEIIREQGEWIVEYTNLQWLLENENPGK